jgi:hypothetical protein
MERQLTPVNGRIYNNGLVSTGWFDQPFREVNIDEALRRDHYFLSLFSNYRLKHWFYFFVANQDYLLAGVMFNSGYYNEFFIYLFDRISNELIEFNASSFLSDNDSYISTSSILGGSVYRQNRNHFSIMSVENGDLIVNLNVRNNHYRLAGQVTLINYGEPLVNIRSVDVNRLIYTHQNSLLKVTGGIGLITPEQHINIEFDDNSRGGIDFTMGYHTYHTDWYWASAFGIGNINGETFEVAINFARDINVTPHTTNNIFCYWIDDVIYRIYEHVNFVRMDRFRWMITSPSINLVFSIEGTRHKSFNIGLLGYHYTQPIGTYTGEILHNDQWINVELFGVFEEHHSKW